MRVSSYPVFFFFPKDTHLRNYIKNAKGSRRLNGRRITRLRFFPTGSAVTTRANCIISRLTENYDADLAAGQEWRAPSAPFSRDPRARAVSSWHGFFTCSQILDPTCLHYRRYGRSVTLCKERGIAGPPLRERDLVSRAPARSATCVRDAAEETRGIA